MSYLYEQNQSKFLQFLPFALRDRKKPDSLVFTKECDVVKRTDICSTHLLLSKLSLSTLNITNNSNSRYSDTNKSECMSVRYPFRLNGTADFQTGCTIGHDLV